MTSWFRHDGDRLIVSIYAQPGARKTEIQGLHDGALKIRVAAPPLEGRANEEISRFLGETFSVSGRSVCLIAGEKSRSKRFSVLGVAPEALLNLRNKL